MFRLRGRLVDPSLNRVTSDGLTVQVEPKIMHVLVTLADRPGEVVTRDELMACVWPGVFVTDDVLHRAIRELRRLFADDAEQPAVIETIRKRGYRLIAPIERIDRPAAPARGVSVPDPAPTVSGGAAASGRCPRRCPAPAAAPRRGPPALPRSACCSSRRPSPASRSFASASAGPRRWTPRRASASRR
jgi:DNA-binding winged helix-turn-helix (wHTH) protein